MFPRFGEELIAGPEVCHFGGNAYAGALPVTAGSSCFWGVERMGRPGHPGFSSPEAASDRAGRRAQDTSWRRAKSCSAPPAGAIGIAIPRST